MVPEGTEEIFSPGGTHLEAGVPVGGRLAERRADICTVLVCIVACVEGQSRYVVLRENE